MGYVEVPSTQNFNTKFKTFVIAFCPDTASWFVTNERYFFYEYEKEFQTEEEGIAFFKENPDIFYQKELEMNFPRPSFLNGGVWLENIKQLITIKVKEEPSCDSIKELDYE